MAGRKTRVRRIVGSIMIDKEVILRKYPEIRGRSSKSVEKVADSYMELSSKLHFSLLVAFVSVPVILLVRVIFLGRVERISMGGHGSMLLYIIQFFVVLGLIFSRKYRKYALDLYDYAEDLREEKEYNRVKDSRFRRGSCRCNR